MPYFRVKGQIVEAHPCRVCGGRRRGGHRAQHDDDRCGACHSYGFVARFVTCTACVTQVIATGKGQPSCPSCRGFGIQNYPFDVPPIFAERNLFG